MKKCKGCQWYGKPYWSIINPCDNCPNENDNIKIITIDKEPTFKETLTDEQIQRSILDKAELNAIIEQKDKKIERLNNIINELEKELDRLLERQYESERFAKEQGFDTYLPAKENLLCLKNKLQELKENKQCE